MTKRLLIGLLSAGMALTLALPGAAVAKEKDKDKHVCKNGGWEELVDDGGNEFADQGECVAHVAEGGTATPPEPESGFMDKCASTSGTYETSVVRSGETYAPACVWSGLDSVSYSLRLVTMGASCYFDLGIIGSGEWFDSTVTPTDSGYGCKPS